MTITPIALSGADSTGRLYHDGRSYLRCIAPTAEQAVRELFSSGLIATLVDRGLFPESVEDGTVFQFPDGFAGSLAVRHAELKPVTYPREWSFLMVKEAALTFLEIISVASQYGYTLRDAHPFNFVFYRNHPVWVDLGSFCKKQPQTPHPWLEEFFTSYLVPLQIWEEQPFLARKIIGSPVQSLAFKESVKLLFLPRSNSVLIHGIGKIIAKILSIDNYQGRNFLLLTIKIFLKKNTAARVNLLQKRICALKYRQSSQWALYHDEFLVDGKVPEVLDSRFERIFSLISEANPQSVLELAGNSGILSEIIARRMPHLPVICTDYDPLAIDSLFSRQRRHPLHNLSCSAIDFMCTEYSNAEENPYVRFKSDCVLALAVSHHLSLSQGYAFDDIFAMIKNYSSRQVFIEFMPLGLHDGKTAPEIPEWYTEENFKTAFEKFFTVDRIERLDDNRIIFCGKII